MPISITPITLGSKMMTVNCYLVRSEENFILVDTGVSNQRKSLLAGLDAAGVHAGNLKLVLITHGDLDHTGNAAHLRQRYGAPLAMHPGDAVNVVSGDMFANKKVSPFTRAVMKVLMPLVGLGGFEKFTPDVLLEDGQSLAAYGLDAAVYHLPGHSRGSVGILTAEGDFFCGDLLENTKQPAVNTLADDPAEIIASAEKATALPVRMVYPGHGKPFPMTELRAGG